jgi:hypothetical protein
MTVFSPDAALANNWSLMENVINWFLEGESWVQYHTRNDLLNQAEIDTGTSAAKAETEI